MTIVCPHCKSNALVGHIEFSSLICLVCEKDVPLGDWLISIKAFSLTKRAADVKPRRAVKAKSRKASRA